MNIKSRIRALEENSSRETKVLARLVLRGVFGHPVHLLVCIRDGPSKTPMFWNKEDFLAWARERHLSQKEIDDSLKLVNW
jgi:hypothetical protein